VESYERGSRLERSKVGRMRRGDEIKGEGEVYEGKESKDEERG
jgi:hypothetical protein